MKRSLGILQKNYYLLNNSSAAASAFLSNWDNSLTHTKEFYIKATKYFSASLPGELQDHRKYFTKEMRGFGEDAFHVMWYLIHAKYQIKTFLEIGVYRGQTISLLSLLAKISNKPIDVWGISPFSSAGDSVSDYLKKIDYLQDTLKNFEYFKLKKPTLIKAFSNDKAALDVITSRLWDCIYIDGSHDYDIVLADWNVCSKQVPVGGLIVMDDASRNIKEDLPLFAFKGHDGPSKVADAVNTSQFREVLRVGHNRAFERIR